MKKDEGRQPAADKPLTAIKESCPRIFWAELRITDYIFLRDYMSNIWGNVCIAIMGVGQGVWPKTFFMVHMTMSTGSLASPPPMGGDS